MDKGSVINLRMNRLGYTEPAIDGKSYEAVFRRLQPVPTDYFCEPGSPPNLRDRALFDDLSYNRELRRNQRIIKARFQGGTIAYVFDDELELYAAAFAKPFFRPDDAETGLYHVLDRLGPMDKRQIMEELDMKGPEVTKILRKFQMAFKVYEIQPDAFGEQVWQTYESEWPQFNIHRYSRQEARMKVVLGFMRNMVFSDEAMVGDWTRLKKSETGEIIAGLLDAGRITGCSLEGANGYIATEDICLLDSRGLPGPRHSVHILHKADYLTRAFESRLKSRYSDKEVLQYVLLNGEISGAVEGHWRIGPHDVENISIDPDAVLYEGQADEIMEAVKAIYKKPYSNVLRFNGNLI